MPTNLLLISFYAEKSETVYQTKVMNTDFLEKLCCASPFCPAVPLYFFMEDIIFVRFNIFFSISLYTKSNKNLHTRKLHHSVSSARECKCSSPSSLKTYEVPILSFQGKDEVGCLNP